ncbi:hypothetical protein ACP70R_022145 [Stipagrostis hirtigluma subsp. patula]
MALTVSPLLLLLVLAATASSPLLAVAAPTLPPSPSPVPPPPCVPPHPTVAFLRARCGSTQYHLTCYDSLIAYGCAFQTSPVKLARAAADVNAARLRALSAGVKELAARGGVPAAEAAALRECASTVSTAAGLAKETAAELAKLDAAGAAAGKSQVRWAISNAQTWLSAAMTNEATCADGLGAAGPAKSPAARDVVIGVVSAKEHTSIALALVNGMPLPPL